MRARRLMTAGLLVVTAGLVLAGCGGDDKTESTATTKGTTSATTGVGTGSVGAPSEALTVVTKDFQFEPATLTAKVGKQVTVTVKNEGQAEHNFSITSLNVNKDVEKGQSAVVSFTPTQAGKIEFFCEYHKASKNMVGTLTVT
jgi:plastocyanin